MSDIEAMRMSLGATVRACPDSGRALTPAERRVPTDIPCSCGRTVNGTYNRFRKAWTLVKHTRPLGAIRDPK